MSKTTWVVVDDDPDIIKSIEAMSKIWDLDLIVLKDGFQAVNWLRQMRQGQHTGPVPELALIDIRFRGKPGHEIAAEMRRLPLLEPMAIILMTAYPLSPRERTYYTNTVQADGIIEKPLPRLFELNRMTQAAIEARQQSQP